MTFAQIQAQRHLILQIAGRYGAYSVRVFGSVLHDTATMDSDLDLLLTMESGKSLLDLIAIKQDLEDALHCRVDVVTEQALSPYFRADVLREAKPL